ncbi:bifunctional DNA-formamidopyrimidine glycosylase/DNA-(apurinic or apyrimidinic site) lyase [Candidatus Saccharibacteria bacterium]|nr:bifunctional DNA-formamidopyrimidine glycosylase/DNA-(apurinic or apyrimidinic site) lyase [Candidatus Saccharibacteria bacterium]
MPELPEVETIKRGLEGFCLRQKIRRVEVLCEKSFIGPQEAVLGREIIKFRRFGKALVVDLSGGVSLMIHLRMTGQLIYREKENAKSSFAGGHPSESFVEELPNKQTRVVLTLSKGVLYFNDQRKFGFIKVLPTEEVEQDEFIASLAPEPWQMKPEELYRTFQRRSGSPVKAAILDQKVIAGIGNIYADEALFYAGVHPRRLCGSLSLKETARIIEGAAKAMDASIKSGGSTMATYVRADGTRGDYLELFAKVFRREGQPCVKCGNEIIKIRVAGRGTHICPCCQKEGSDD